MSKRITEGLWGGTVHLQVDRMDDISQQTEQLTEQLQQLIIMLYANNIQLLLVVVLLIYF